MKKFITLLFIISLTVMVGNSSYANVTPDIVPAGDVFTNDHVSPLFYDVNITEPTLFFAGLDGYEAVNLDGVDSVNVDGSKTAVDMRSYDGKGLIVVGCSKAFRGTNPTLSIIIRTSSDNFSTDSTTIKTFTTVTTSASNQVYLLDIGEQKRYWRVAYDIGGTAVPMYYVGVKVIAKKKYL